MLAVGATSEVVTVNADASQLQSETSDVGTSISPKLLEDLPLSFGGTVRDPLQFVTLTPGYAGTVTSSPTSPPSGGFKINGGQQDGVQIILDGSNLNLISANMQVNYGVSVEAISEFKVESNTFNAEYGKASGGLVNLVTKSGTDQIHGLRPAQEQGSRCQQLGQQLQRHQAAHRHTERLWRPRFRPCFRSQAL
jgi:outer membrane receptor protein involved in Fe transport